MAANPNTGAASAAPNFRENTPTFAIRNSYAIITWRDGDAEAMPLNKFRIMLAMAAQELAQYDSHSAEVIPIRTAPARRRAKQ